MKWITANQAPAQRRAANSLGEAADFWTDLSDFYVSHTALNDLRTRAIASTFVREAGIGPTDQVLDAGCGHLRISLALLRLVPGVKLTGVDLTPQLLEAGQKILERLGYPKIPLHEADLCDLPFEDDQFDHIVSARVFQYIADPLAACRELWRVLKPGGRLILSVPNELNPIKKLRYQGRLHRPYELVQWLAHTGFTEVLQGSACFVPGLFRRPWDSSWISAELAAKVPGLGQIGGNAWACGTKPRDI